MDFIWIQIIVLVRGTWVIFFFLKSVALRLLRACLGRSIKLLQIYIIDQFQDRKQAILPNIFVPFFAVQYHGRNNFCHM